MSAAGPAAVPVSAEEAVPRGAAVWDALVRFARPLANLVISLAIVVLGWIVFLRIFSINPLVAKSPSAVWRYLFDGPNAGADRSLVWHGLSRTLEDASVGFFGGLAAAVVVALVFVLARSVEQTFMPIALVVRSVPLVAMTPVITLVAGRGLLGTTVISGIVVYFPALVTIVFGLRSTSRQAAELCRAYGANRFTVARKVMLPSALPALFASARIGVPSALIGAMLAEWLSTGQGLGYAMLEDQSTFHYDNLWASVAVLTGVSIVLYNVIAAAESLVLARFSLAGGRRPG